MERKFVVVPILLAMVAACDALCKPGMLCKEPRDHIVHSPKSISAVEIQRCKDRNWFIMPGKVTNVLLHFKQFDWKTFKGISPVAFGYLNNKMTTHKAFKPLKPSSTNGGMFTPSTSQGTDRVIFENVDFVRVWLPFTIGMNGPSTPDFEITYHAGCGVVRHNDTKLHFSSSSAETCWFMEISNQVKATYFAARNVHFGPHQKLVVWDSHTNEQVMVLEGKQTGYDPQGIDFDSATSRIIELVCARDRSSDKLHTCDFSQTSFTLTHYAMMFTDVQCIRHKEETRQWCHGKNHPSVVQWCNEPCPGFDRIIKAEYGVGIGNSEKETSPLVRTSELYVDGFLPKPVVCPMHSSFCRCPRHINRNQYCSRSARCKDPWKVKQFCRWACIWTKIVECKKRVIQRGYHVKLL